MNAPFPPGVLTDQAELARRLERETEGEVLFDLASRGRYATDASIYQAIPIGVFVPKTARDVAIALQIAREMGAPLLPRGGGTSQCGQTTGAALVIDFSKHLRNIVSLDVEGRRVQVEPGDLQGRTAIVDVRPAEYTTPSGDTIRRNEVPYDGWRNANDGRADA